MTLEALIHHTCLVVATAALLGAAVRVASLAVPRGLERVLAAVVLATAAAVAEALGLGLVKLGGSAVALTLAAIATWVAARALVRVPEHGVLDELGAWGRAVDVRVAVSVGAAAGGWCAWSAWVLARPALGHDMVVYHLPEALAWVHGGQPGSVVTVVDRLPVGSYALTHEVLLEWGMAISRGFVWPTIVTAAVPVLVATAAWVGLRALSLDRAVAALGAAALVATPAVLASQSGGASLDPAALAWLVTCAALVAGAGARPALLAPAVVAGGLAVGTKTTAAPLAIVVLALAAWGHRGRLRAMAPALGGAAAVAVAVGGVWYLRNLFVHGWPLWPFQSGPVGDPVPSPIAATDTTFLERPGETLSRLGSYYWHHFGGPLILLGGALAAALAARRRAVLAAAAATGVSVLLWANAPFTGVLQTHAFDIGTGDATRYLLPGVAAAVLTLALASRRAGLRVPVIAVLAAAAAVGLYETLDLGYPSAPPAWVPAAGAVVGALAAAVLRRVPIPALPRAAVAVAALALLAVGSAAAADGFVERHARTDVRGTELARWFATQPEWRDGHTPVLSTFLVLAPLAGDRLEHPLELVPARTACRRAAAAHAWLVLDRLAQRVARVPECGPPDHATREYVVYRPR